METVQFIVGLIVLAWGILTILAGIGQRFFIGAIAEGDRTFNKVGNIFVTMAVLIGAGISFVGYLILTH